MCVRAKGTPRIYPPRMRGMHPLFELLVFNNCASSFNEYEMESVPRPQGLFGCVWGGYD